MVACQSPDSTVQRQLGMLALVPLEPLEDPAVVATVPAVYLAPARPPRRIRRVSLARLRHPRIRAAVPLAPADVSHVGWKRTLGTTYMLARGNANVSNLGFTGSIARRSRRSQIALHATRQFGSKDGAPTQNFLSTTLRYDLALGPSDSKDADRPSFFSEVTYEHDPFAKVGQRTVENTGLSVPLARDPDDKLAVEIGTGVTHEAPSGAPPYTRVGGLLRLAARQVFGGATAQQQIAAFPDITGPPGHYRLNSDLNLAAPLTKAVSLKVGLINRYDTRPQADVRKSDTTIQSGVGVAF